MLGPRLLPVDGAGQVVQFFFSSRRRHTRYWRDWSSAVCSSDLWRFSATTAPCRIARFLTVVDTHGSDRPDMEVVRKRDTFRIGDWSVECNLKEHGKAAISVSNRKEKVSLTYDAGKKEGATLVTERVKGKQVEHTLTDYLPDLEI